MAAASSPLLCHQDGEDVGDAAQQDIAVVCAAVGPRHVSGVVAVQEAHKLPHIKVKVGKSLHRLNFPVLTSSFRPLFDLPDAPSAVPPTSSEWVPGRPVPKPWRF